MAVPKKHQDPAVTRYDLRLMKYGEERAFPVKGFADVENSRGTVSQMKKLTGWRFTTRYDSKNSLLYVTKLAPK